MFVLGVVLLVVAGIVSLVGSVMIAVAAFRESILWGVCVLLVPFAAIVFVILRWQTAKRGVLTSVASVGCFALGFALIIASAPREITKATASARPVTAEAAATPAAAPEPVVRPREVSNAYAPAPETPPATVAKSAPEIRAVPVAVPPLMDLDELKPSTLHKHVGETLLIYQRDGRHFKGKLLALDGSTLRMERYINGGTVNYDISRSDVAEVHPAY